LALRGDLWPVRDRKLSQFLIWSIIYVGYVTGTFALLARGGSDAKPVTVAIEFLLITWALVLLMAEPRRLKVASTTIALTALVSTAINVFDFLVPTFSEVLGRAAGFYGDPNISGNWIAMAMIVGLAAVPRRLRFAFMTICGVGVLVTFSRGAWLIWGIAFAFAYQQGHVGLRRRSKFNLRLNWIVGLVLGGGFLVLVFSGALGEVIGKSSLSAYLTDNTLSRLGISTGVLSGDSFEVRETLIFRSLNEATTAPVFGHGFGYTSPWIERPHNMYLLFLVEGGIIGAAIYVALMLMMWRFGDEQGSIVALQFAVYSLFTHNNFEQPAMMIFIAFVFAHAVVRAHARRRSFVSVGHAQRRRPANNRRTGRFPTSMPAASWQSRNPILESQT
jgi:O-antigen ligase